MVLLQAAIGFGMLLLWIGKILLFGGVPLLTAVLAVRAAKKDAKAGAARLSTGDYVSHFLRSFSYALLVILALGIVLVILLALSIPLGNT